MNAPINTAAVTALADEPVDVHSKGLPISWSGRTPAQICAATPNLFAAGPVGPVCTLRGDALAHNLATMASWCARRGIVLRSGCYLTHDDGLYQRTSPLARPDAGADRLRPALSVWAQVCSRPEPELAVLNMGRRDVSFDQDLPTPQFVHTENGWSTEGLDRCEVVKLNDQHAFLRLGLDARIDVGSWLQFGISHPCTVFDKWRLIPILDAQDRVVEIIRTFF